MYIKGHIDMLYCAGKYASSFISKDTISTVPMIGYLAKAV